MGISYPDSNRVGKFRVFYEVLRSGPDRPLLKALFSLCVCLMEEEDDTGRGHMFYMASLLFQPLAEGEEIPEYRIDSAWPDQAFPNPEHERDCLHVGGFRFKAIRQNIVRVPPLAVAVRTPTPLH